MNKNTVIVALLVVAVLAGVGSYKLGMQEGLRSSGADSEPAQISAMNSPSSREDPSQWNPAQREDATRRHISEGIAAGDIDPVTGLEVLHYYDPMMPASKFAAPGKSPFMDMMLVPAYEGMVEADASTVHINARQQQNSGIRTAEVNAGSLAQEINAVGAIAWNEREERVLQSRTAGFVERLHVRAVLDRVETGQPLVELYVPEWVAVQEEFLALTRMQNDDLASLLDAARVRMRQAGMNEEQIRTVTASGQVQATFTLTSPVSGVVSELGIREGATVMPGDLLFRLNGTDTVWAYADVPESQAALLAVGDEVTATSPSLPGITITGTVQAMLAEVNPTLRTRRARIELPNADARLAAGMLMQMHFKSKERENVLLIPTEALIRTGTRTVVMLAETEGRFHPQEVTTGLETNGQTEILQGLEAGQEVVISGQFLIDSEASLMGLETRLNAFEVEPVSPQVHRTEARIEAIAMDTVTLAHPPIASLSWPAMSMTFKLPEDRAMISDLSVGAQVNVEFYMDDDGRPQVLMIEPLEPLGGTR